MGKTRGEKVVWEYLYEIFVVKSCREMSYLDVCVSVLIVAFLIALLYATIALVRYIRSVVVFKRIDKRLDELLEKEENENREWQNSQEKEE